MTGISTSYRSTSTSTSRIRPSHLGSLPSARAEPNPGTPARTGSRPVRSSRLEPQSGLVSAWGEASHKGFYQRHADRQLSNNQKVTNHEKKGVPLEVGARVGDWTVLAKPMKVGKACKVECVCLCGTHRSVSAISLRAGHSRDCGCGREISRAQNDGMVVTNDPSRSAEVHEEVALIRDGYAFGGSVLCHRRSTGLDAVVHCRCAGDQPVGIDQPSDAQRPAVFGGDQDTTGGLKGQSELALTGY